MPPCLHSCLIPCFTDLTQCFAATDLLKDATLQPSIGSDAPMQVADGRLASGEESEEPTDLKISPFFENVEDYSIASVSLSGAAALPWAARTLGKERCTPYVRLRILSCPRIALLHCYALVNSTSRAFCDVPALFSCNVLPFGKQGH